ncbi:hypothetical protein QBC41DRAFT_14483 [Cercophora samala]|uniref:Uncharacterized protein n=1 Tax=Cercophora samala TaxID=330535 RepID=A0AA39ZKK5_9PEZI|nr:hypothetical protein QBC41DRAFT_14483 [Cercophora samala]
MQIGFGNDGAQKDSIAACCPTSWSALVEGGKRVSPTHKNICAGIRAQLFDVVDRDKGAIPESAPAVHWHNLGGYLGWVIHPTGRGRSDHGGLATCLFSFRPGPHECGSETIDSVTTNARDIPPPPHPGKFRRASHFPKLKVTLHTSTLFTWRPNQDSEVGQGPVSLVVPDWGLVLLLIFETVPRGQVLAKIPQRLLIYLDYLTGVETEKAPSPPPPSPLICQSLSVRYQA